MRYGLCVLTMAVAAAVSVNAYTISAPWRTPIVYMINPANVYGFTPEEVERAVAEALRPWTVANPEIAITYGGRTTTRTTNCTDKRNVIYFEPKQVTNLLAEATSCYEYRVDDAGVRYRYRKYDVDIALFEKNGSGAKRPFIIDDRQCVPSGWYVQDVLTHEFGHLLGLGHVSPRVPTMYRALGKCAQIWRTLEADDFDGIRALYPKEGSIGGPYWRTHRARRDGGDIGIN